MLHDAWRLDTYTGLIFAMVLAAVLSLVFELMDIIKLKLLKKCWPDGRSLQNSNCSLSSINLRLTKAIFYTCQLIMTYILMLCVMTMNIWILVTILLGTAAGYYCKRISRKRPPNAELQVGVNYPGIQITSETIVRNKHCQPLLNKEGIRLQSEADPMIDKEEGCITRLAFH
ncbi:protein SLC31A2-like [Saccostrea echinata]|uniref:protein SLC31A2-like n=1 Tax=Saccostrea echinata TaxID=191078 RepID=UPI002A82DD80|nr:protein SLC31A2-like [Saccostrea echinata]